MQPTRTLRVLGTTEVVGFRFLFVSDDLQPDMHVREATVEDIQAIRQVAEAAWRSDYTDAVEQSAIESGVNHWYSDPVVRMELSNPGTEFRVAEVEEVIVGFVHAHRSGPVGTILRLHVSPEYRESGVEGGLFESIAQDLDGEKTDFRATVLAANDHMKAFYEKRGFEHSDTEQTTIGQTQYDETVLERT